MYFTGDSELIVLPQRTVANSAVTSEEASTGKEACTGEEDTGESRGVCFSSKCLLANVVRASEVSEHARMSKCLTDRLTC
jgi:hypothetical protein